MDYSELFWFENFCQKYFLELAKLTKSVSEFLLGLALNIVDQ